MPDGLLYVRVSESGMKNGDKTVPRSCMRLPAVFFCKNSRKNIKKENYSSEGMALGMCFGVTIGSGIEKEE